MEQGYAFKPSAPAPLSAAPPSEYPREAFGTRSSMDLSRIPHAKPSPNVTAVGAAASSLAPPHVLFDAERGDANGADESNDWGEEAEEEAKGAKKASTSA